MLDMTLRRKVHAASNSRLEIVLPSREANVNATRNEFNDNCREVERNLGPRCADIMTALLQHGCTWSRENLTHLRENLNQGAIPRYQVQDEDVLS